MGEGRRLSPPLLVDKAMVRVERDPRRRRLRYNRQSLLSVEEGVLLIEVDLLVRRRQRLPRLVVITLDIPRLRVEAREGGVI